MQSKPATFHLTDKASMFTKLLNETEVIEVYTATQSKPSPFHLTDMAASIAMEEVIALFFSSSGDPTDGIATQHSTLFVNQKILLTSHTICGKEIDVQQTPADLKRPGVTGCVVWNSAVLLGRVLEDWQAQNLLSLYDLNVLELGSGSGLLAIVCALLGAKTVVATDQEERLPQLKRNLVSNEVANLVVARELDWSDHETLFDEDVDPPNLEYNLVVATDCIYNEAVTVLFVKTLAKLNCQFAIIALELRTQEVQSVFIESLVISGAVLNIHRLPVSAFPEEVRTDRVAVYLIEFGLV